MENIDAKRVRENSGKNPVELSGETASRTIDKKKERDSLVTNTDERSGSSTYLTQHLRLSHAVRKNTS